MTIEQIRANSKDGKIVFPERVIKVKTPECCIEKAYYLQQDGTYKGVVFEEKGDISNIRLPFTQSTQKG